MKSEYVQKENGLYILSKNDIENIADGVIREYAPQNLEHPTSLDTVDFLENYLGLVVKCKYIGPFGSKILGLIVMSDIVEIPSYDDMFKPVILEETFGNILITPALYNIDQYTRRRYTQIHEGAHFILHRAYYGRKNENLRNRVGASSSYIACRSVELNKTKNITDNDWIEWQADALAASLLMPMNVFVNYTYKIMSKNGISGKYISVPETFSEKKRLNSIIADIANVFQVSCKAVQIRMLNLGIIKNTYRYT